MIELVKQFNYYYKVDYPKNNSWRMDLLYIALSKYEMASTQYNSIWMLGIRT
jgi:hypothetical protein